MSLTDEQVKEMLASLSPTEVQTLAGLLAPAPKPSPPVQTKPRDGAFHKGKHYICKWRYWTISVPHHYTCMLCGTITHHEHTIEILSKEQPIPEEHAVKDTIEWCHHCYSVLGKFEHFCLIEHVINQAKQRGAGMNQNSRLADKPMEHVPSPKATQDIPEEEDEDE